MILLARFVDCSWDIPIYVKLLETIYFRKKKNSGKCLPGKVWFLKGDEGTFNISMHLFKQIYSNLEKKSPTISTQVA